MDELKEMLAKQMFGENIQEPGILFRAFFIIPILEKIIFVF
jgi:hypothetical protein